jgi:hypothetical protein
MGQHHVFYFPWGYPCHKKKRRKITYHRGERCWGRERERGIHRERECTCHKNVSQKETMWQHHVFHLPWPRLLLSLRSIPITDVIG